MFIFLKRKFLSLILRIMCRVHESNRVSDSISVFLENIYSIINGRKVRFGIETNGTIYAMEEGRKVQISNKHRGFKLYRQGIKERELVLFKSYCLQHVNLNVDDLVFDCGANSGDLFLSLSRLINPENYFGFEPNPSDFKVLVNNVHFKSKIFNFALGNTNSELFFYTYTRGGDSSLIEPKFWDEKIKVPVVRLDSFLKDNHITAVKLLKLEAEGFEPEILYGLGDRILCCEYIAIDGGPERGKECEQTFTTCTNYLISKGFSLIDIDFQWYRALYHRSTSI